MLLLLTALLLEWVAGDPDNRYHPVAWFGRWAAWCETWLYQQNRVAGIAAWSVVVLGTLLLLWLGETIFGWLFDLLILWLSIGWKSLFHHVRAVLDAGNIEQARAAVSQIVSRDCEQMSAEEVRRAALESLAENSSDAIIAPLFWFLIAGPLGAACYRMINTLDAMWGYRSTRYRHFGWWAAKVDDWANWFPARITAALILWCGQQTAPLRQRWQQIQPQAKTHASPNAGWPETALAWAASIRLGGDIQRQGRCDHRPWYGADLARSCSAEAAFEACLIVQQALIRFTLIAIIVAIVL